MHYPLAVEIVYALQYLMDNKDCSFLTEIDFIKKPIKKFTAL